MTRVLTVARSILGARPLAADPGAHDPGRVVMARALLSLPTLVERWREAASECRATDPRRAEAIERCAADVEAVIGGGV